VTQQPLPLSRHEIAGTHPGPSRTITVEPVKVPRAPRVIPVPGPKREPERPQRKPEREPVPAR
jgi:hypothetical protein